MILKETQRELERWWMFWKWMKRTKLNFPENCSCTFKTIHINQEWARFQFTRYRHLRVDVIHRFSVIWKKKISLYIPAFGYNNNNPVFRTSTRISGTWDFRYGLLRTKPPVETSHSLFLQGFPNTHYFCDIFSASLFR